MVALDLDGTLLEPAGVIVPSTLKQLARINDQGLKIAIATGRPYARTIDPLVANGLYPQGISPHFLICEERDIYELKSGIYVPWETNSSNFEEELNYLALGRKLIAQLEAELSSLEFAINNNFSQRSRGFVETYFVYSHEAHQAFAWLTELTADTPLKVTRNGRNVCLRSRNVGKGIKLKAIAECFGFTLDQVLAVGDSHNDLEMLKSGVRPATTNNADSEIKEVVKKRAGLISSLDNSLGVGEIIEMVVK